MIRNIYLILVFFASVPSPQTLLLLPENIRSVPVSYSVDTGLKPAWSLDYNTAPQCQSYLPVPVNHSHSPANPAGSALHGEFLPTFPPRIMCNHPNIPRRPEALAHSVDVSNTSKHQSSTFLDSPVATTSESRRVVVARKGSCG